MDATRNTQIRSLQAGWSQSSRSNSTTFPVSLAFRLVSPAFVLVSVLKLLLRFRIRRFLSSSAASFFFCSPTLATFGSHGTTSILLAFILRSRCNRRFSSSSSGVSLFTTIVSSLSPAFARSLSLSCVLLCLSLSLSLSLPLEEERRLLEDDLFF